MKAHLTFVTGGSKSGKSAFAESLFKRTDPICYIATGIALRGDSEIQLRIKKHQKRRSRNWVTEERYKDFASFIATHQYAGYLLDDATMSVTNLFYDLITNHKKENSLSFDSIVEQLSTESLQSFENVILGEWNRLFEMAENNHQRLVIVSDEVGLGIVPATKQSRVLRDLYGEVNQLIARKADDVYFVISGLPQKIK
ncbi:bifunctional adenosylcobinamide kinase/adenosylcobinamide-phosphate guanylyltransferase [Lentilactobacillus raoultii]|uniref:Adenosylcobinamide kinase n=1 Tax=Lentilactobacillus raoultii TaxID=1987503 RepID=A0ABW3PCB0_9LACO|nr:bifunctional adenosylcobinamide kinase/adenosylcobinamide-phosphate guanylyltransferase [Lentilactobacillus raoultii]